MDLSNLPKLNAFSQHTTIYIDPTKLEEFWQAFTPVFEKTSSTPECLYLEMFEDPAVPGKLTCIANWNETVEWLMTMHAAKEYFQSYLAITEPLFTQPQESEIWKRKEGYVVGKKGNFEKGKMDEGFSLHVTVHIKPECVKDFWKEWDVIFNIVIEEEDCLYFEVYEDPNVPGKISWVENWGKSLDRFWKEQFSKEYYKPYLAATEAMFAKEREFKILKRRGNSVYFKPENFEGARVGDYGVQS